MKKSLPAMVAIAIFASAPALAKEIVVTDAKIAGGKLKITGTTPGPNQNITLDDNFTVMSDASTNFSFVLTNYFPLTCIANLAVGANHTATAVVANCATMKRGADVNGSVSLSGIANGRCTQVTFNVGGAKVGEMPLVITKAAIQNGIVLHPARVASDGHVEVNACNFSGTMMTPISGFPIRLITLP